VGRGLLLEYVFLEVATVLLVRRDLGVVARVGRLLLDAEELDFGGRLAEVHPAGVILN